MSNAVVQIKRQHQADADPLRAALAAAITAEEEAKRALDAARENLQKGDRVLDAARVGLENARTLAERAKERDGRAAAASIRKSAGAPQDASKTVRGARLRVQELEDDVEIADAAIERLRDDLVQAEAAVRWAAVATMTCRNAVLAPIARELIDRTVDFRRSFALCRSLLIALLNDPSKGAPEFPDDTLAGLKAREQISGPIAELRVAAETATLTSVARTIEEETAAASAIAALRRAVSSLITNSSVEIPLP